MRTDYPLIFQDSDAVAKYEHVVYAPGSYSSAISRRQRIFLRELVDAEFDRPPVHHDFACGTGRALRMLSDLAAEAHGYDVSAAMLDAATESGVRGELHLIDVTGPAPRPAPTAGPALVTVFRLLLNVSPEVRDRAMAFAAAALPVPGSGLLVVENHGRRRSLRHLTARRHRGDSWYAELSDVDIKDLLARHGFEIVARHGFALTTRGWYHRRTLRGLARRVDDRLAGPLSGLCTDVLYVARRSA
jgi:predicted TPR repeat methyltransferase